MRRIEIRQPIFHSMSIGIAEYKLDHGEVAIEITYRDKHGERMFPGTFLLTPLEACRYPLQKTRGVDLRIIPIKSLRRKK